MQLSRFRSPIIAVVLATLPVGAFAVGSDDSNPPTQTQTTTVCPKGQIWSDKLKACVLPDDSLLDNDTRFRAVRELAWAGRPDNPAAIR